METVLLFALTLLVAVLISELAHRTVLSTAVLFLLVGFFAGPDVGNLIHVTAEDAVVRGVAELALFAVLFTDGMLVREHRRESWGLTGRALLIGLPLTLIGNALLARFIVGVSWLEAFLVGAVLSPTDPVFASSLVDRKEISLRLRRMLNRESGLNDGLALPCVVILTAAASHREFHVLRVIVDVLLGVALGIALPWLALSLRRTRLFETTQRYAPFYAFTIGILLFAVARLTHANEYLAAFAGGATVASVDEEMKRAFKQFGELIAELLKLAAVFLFGALLTPGLFADISWRGYLFAVAVLLLVRPLALGAAYIHREMSRREWVAAAWFGPKGFASVVYSLFVLQAGLPDGARLFHLMALVIALSIFAHSSTDTVVARALARRSPAPMAG